MGAVLSVGAVRSPLPLHEPTPHTSRSGWRETNPPPSAEKEEELVAHFATSPELARDPAGFLRYRADLHAFGLISGFQWVDGSFVERGDVVLPAARHRSRGVLRAPGADGERYRV